MIKANMAIVIQGPRKGAPENLLANVSIAYFAEYKGAMVNTHTVNDYAIWLLKDGSGHFVGLPGQKTGKKKDGKAVYDKIHCLSHGVVGSAVAAILAANPEADIEMDDMISKKPIILDMIEAAWAEKAPELMAKMEERNAGKVDSDLS